MSLTGDVGRAADTILCSLRGRVTRCGDPVTGHRVVGWHQTQLGFSEDGGPCVIGHPSIRKVGETVTDDGNFTINFNALTELPGECFFSSLVRVEVFEGASRVWASGFRTVAPLVRFDRELLPGCTTGSTAVRVIDDEGRAVAAAEVFVNGSPRGQTDATGHAFLEPALEAGDRLVARRLVHENRTPREEHDADSNRNWNYRAYVTSLSVGHDAQGNNVRLTQHVVSDPGNVQELRLRRRNTLIGLNLRASIEWDARSTETDPVSTEEYGRLRDRLTDMSELLYNATDGQFLVERLAIADNGAHWDEADIQIYANLNQPSTANKGGIFGDSGRIRMNPNDSHYAGTLLHELGHYAFGLGDEYEGTDDWDPDNGPVRCTLNSTDPSGPFTDGGDKDSCLMRGNRRNDQKKFCSAHLLNPHVAGTDQGPQDCWTDILERYADPSRWRLQTPVSRQAIPGRLPESGVPLKGFTQPPSDVDRTRSFIPLADWKTKRASAHAIRSGLCQALVVRTVFEGQRRNGVRITLRTSDGRRIHQGVTKSAYNLAYGVQSGPGEIPVRGAHVGDEIEATLLTPPVSLRGRVPIVSCDGPLVVPLVVFDPIPQPELVATDPTIALTTTTRSVWPGERTVVESADGRLRLVLPAGALSAPGLLHVEESADPPVLRDGDELVSGPFALRASPDAQLGDLAQLLFRVPSSEAPAYDDLLVVRLEAGRPAHDVPTVVAEDPLIVTASVDQLGIYALVTRPAR